MRTERKCPRWACASEQAQQAMGNVQPSPWLDLIRFLGSCAGMVFDVSTWDLP